MEVNNNFKNKIKSLGRQFDVRVYYTTMYKLITEDNKLLITQDNVQLITEQTSTEYDAYFNGEEIKKLTKNNLGELFKTYMKSFDLEATHELYVGQNVNIELGVKEEQDTDFEYINYGTYYIYKKTYNEDTKTFTYMLCDKMMFTMIPYDNDAIFRSATELTCEELITRIIEYTDIIRVDLDSIVNGNRIVNKETLEGIEITCRDVLDMIMQSQGCSLVIENDENGEIAVAKTIGNVVETIDEDVLSNTNLSFTKKFGKINSLLFSRASGTDNIERKDEQDISVNGYCQYVIENNLIIDQENRESYIDNLFNAIKDIEYYICDFDCTGLGYIDYLDRYNVTAQGNTYPCLCLENTFTIENGMKESFKSGEPTQIKKSYTQGAKDDKNASITMNKLKGQIVLKTYEEDGKTKLAQVRLDSSGEKGSLVEISGDQIDLTGKNINLTGDNVTISSDRFNVDKYGNVECNNATMNDITINKGQIDLSGAYNTAKLTLTNASDNNEKITMSPRQTYFRNRDGSQYLLITNSTLGGSGIQSNIALSNWFSLDAGGLVVKEGSTSSTIYGDSIYTPVLYQTSKESNKKNIEKLPSGLDIVKNIDICKYHLKTQEENEKKHIGFVIGEKYKYSKELTNNNDESVDLYSFISVCCKAIQEQQEQIEELKKEIENLKGGNK
jgi:hypothetical protein